jgi:hypothetical protein
MIIIINSSKEKKKKTCPCKRVLMLFQSEAALQQRLAQALKDQSIAEVRFIIRVEAPHQTALTTAGQIQAAEGTGRREAERMCPTPPRTDREHSRRSSGGPDTLQAANAHIAELKAAHEKELLIERTRATKAEILVPFTQCLSFSLCSEHRDAHARTAEREGAEPHAEGKAKRRADADLRRAVEQVRRREVKSETPGRIGWICTRGRDSGGMEAPPISLAL